ncbi:MAG: protease complex subunit PrcB family protein [Nitrososphaeria archaeon]
MTDEIKKTEINFNRLDTRQLKPDRIPAQNIIFTNKEQWKEFWAKYGSGVEPEINFEKYIAVGVFLGEKPNPGYGVEIIDIKKKGEEVKIEFIEYLPNPLKGYIQIIVYPYDIVYFPKTEGKIVFFESKKMRE